jgi:class 3 adenylate cyclase
MVKGPTGCFSMITDSQPLPGHKHDCDGADGICGAFSKELKAGIIRFEWINEKSDLALYLTQKGSGVDPNITWNRKEYQKKEVDVQQRASSHKRQVQGCLHQSNLEFAEETCKPSTKYRRVTPTTFDPEDASYAFKSQKNTSCPELFRDVRRITNLELHQNNEIEETGIHRHEINAPDYQVTWPQLSNDASRRQSVEHTACCQSLPNVGSIRIASHSAAEVTVLLIDIKGFTSQCAEASVGSVGEWVAAFYERVDAAAAAYGVSKVEVRGDCCVCVAGAEGAVPAPAVSAPAAADRRADQATRMLAFAAVLHRDLATLPAVATGTSTTARMGVATGEAAFLVSDTAADPGAAPFASVLGDTMMLAGQMEALAAPGLVYVHRSTADKWAKEAGRAPPASVVVECKGGFTARAAVFDCGAGAFRGVKDSRGGAVLRRRNSFF